jgi:hypothetical protein
MNGKSLPIKGISSLHLITPKALNSKNLVGSQLVLDGGRGGIRPAYASKPEYKTIDFTSDNQSKSYLPRIYPSSSFHPRIGNNFGNTWRLIASSKKGGEISCVVLVGRIRLSWHMVQNLLPARSPGDCQRGEFV